MTPPERATPPLACTGLVKRLGGQPVVDRVSLAFEAGSWTAVVGPNGAGKSTLLALLAGLLRPDEGKVALHGREVRDWPARERARRLAWLPQAGAAEGGDDDLSAIDVARLGRLPRHGLFGSPGPEDEAATGAAMAETRSGELALRRLRTLSGGEKQRVLLARAYAVQAPVLLLDEPAAHLDAPHQRQLLRGLRRRAAQGDVVVSVLHDLTLALAADRLVVVQRGRVAAAGPADDAALRAALVEVFEAAFSIERIDAAGGPRWVALPAL